MKRKRETSDEAGPRSQDELQPEVEIDQELDRELENKSRQHNLTSANVRNIIHVSALKTFLGLFNLKKGNLIGLRFDVRWNLPGRR